MKAIILAAGMGTRLGKYTKDLPKCMLNFNGKPIIEQQIKTLRSLGINDITIVKGYMPEKIKILGVKNYINEDYTHTNMVETLFTAVEELNGEVLVCYADIIYQKEILQKIIESKVDVGVTVDENYWDYWQARMDKPEEDMESLVLNSDGKIVELGDTNCKRDEANLRYVGLIKFSKFGVEKLKDVYYKNREMFYDNDGPWLKSKSFKKAYMTCMIQAMINEGIEVDPIIINRGWLEFDTVEDYEKYNSWLKKDKLSKFFKNFN